VKHFKWEPRGKRRIHQKPNSREVAACRPWLEAELRLVRPKLLVVLGSTAGQAIFGPSFRVTRERGKVLSSKFAPKVVATVHPSSLLRQPDEESRHREYKNFVSDLRRQRPARTASPHRVAIVRVDVPSLNQTRTEDGECKGKAGDGRMNFQCAEEIPESPLPGFGRPSRPREKWILFRRQIFDRTLCG